jgi:hypothetical protein
MAFTDPLALTISGTSGTTGDLIGGSWRITESVAAIDILDTSGEIGSISASFKRNFQTTGNTPTSTPVPSSDFLQGQTCTFKHPTLGSYTGSITNIDQKGGTITLDIDSALNVVNTDITVPAFADGATFYSWDRTLPDGSVPNKSDVYLNWIQSIWVNSQGNIWVTGGNTGANASTLYDRFGNYIMGLTHAAAGLTILTDSVGNIYVQTSTTVLKFNSSGVFQSTIITVAGYQIAKMTIDSSDNLYLATTDTTGSSAIKKYSTTGTLISGTWGSLSYSPSAPLPATGLVGTYTGMAFLQGTVTTSGVPIIAIGHMGQSFASGTGHTWYGITNLVASTGASSTSDIALGTTDREYAGLGIDWSPVPDQDFLQSGATGNKIIFATKTGLQQFYRNPGGPAAGVQGYTNTTIAPPIDRNKPDRQIWGPFYAQSALKYGVNIPPFAPMSYVADKNGFGYWYALGSTIYRVAGGYMGPNQAIECYLGAAGFRGTVQYGPGFNYYDSSSSLVNFCSWSGNAWSKIKELCSRVNRGITVTSTGVYIYHTDSRTDQIKLDISNRDSEPEISFSEIGAQIINITSTGVSRNTMGHGLLYSASSGDSPIEVAAGRTTYTTISTNAYATAIDPPVVTSPLFGPYVLNDPGISAYTITDSRDISAGGPQMVPTALWNQFGGSLQARPSVDSYGSIDIILTGPQTEIPGGYKGPYRVGYMSGGPAGVFTPNLYLYGQGITGTPENFSVLTGVPVGLSETMNSQNLDSVFIDTAAAGYDLARWSSSNMANGGMTLKVRIPITSSMQFGKIAGSYFFYARNMWRVIKAEYSGGWVDLTCQRDTRYSEAQPSGLTYAQGATLWNGFRYTDNYASPGVNGA